MGEGGPTGLPGLAGPIGPSGLPGPKVSQTALQSTPFARVSQRLEASRDARQACPSEHDSKADKCVSCDMSIRDCS